MLDKRQTTLVTVAMAFLSVAVLLPAASSAQDAGQDADVYLDKMMTMYDGPFTADYDLVLEMNQGGMSMTMNGTGDITWADSTHMVVNVEMTMKMPGMDQEMALTTKTISDGTSTWMVMNNPMVGQQVMKMDIAKAQAKAEEQGMSSNAGMSPFEQLRSMQEFFTFSVRDKSKGKVTLAGVVKDNAPAQLKEAGPLAEGMLLVLNASSGMLESFSMGPVDAPMVTMTLTKFTRTKRSSMRDGLFSYTPPEGVTVMDPLAMQQQEQKQKP